MRQRLPVVAVNVLLGQQKDLHAGSNSLYHLSSHFMVFMETDSQLLVHALAKHVSTRKVLWISIVLCRIPGGHSSNSIVPRKFLFWSSDQPVSRSDESTEATSQAAKDDQRIATLCPPLREHKSNMEREKNKADWDRLIDCTESYIPHTSTSPTITERSIH